MLLSVRREEMIVVLEKVLSESGSDGRPALVVTRANNFAA